MSLERSVVIEQSGTHAKWMRTAPHSRWEGLICYVFAAVEPHFGVPKGKPHRWVADLQLELNDVHRTQWCVARLFGAREDAARECVDFLAVAIPLFEASLQGEDVQTPGQRFASAARAHAVAHPDFLSAFAAEKTARAAYERAVERDAASAGILRSEAWAARDRASAVRRAAEEAFYAAHNWREFICAAHTEAA
jgi:hypothetical protein